MKRVTTACAVLSMVGALTASALAAPVQIDFNTAGFAGPASGTVSTFTKNNAISGLDLKFTSSDESGALTTLYWDADDGNGKGFKDGFGVIGTGYAQDEVEGSERLLLEFSKPVHLLGFNLTDFFFESEPVIGDCPVASPNCYQERGSFMLLFSDLSNSLWFDFTALPGATRATNGEFDLALDFANVVGILYRAPGQSDGGFPSPFTKLEDFSLAGVRIDDTPTVPEPASLMLLGFGLSGIAAARRRRAQQTA